MIVQAIIIAEIGGVSHPPRMYPNTPGLSICIGSSSQPLLPVD